MVRSKVRVRVRVSCFVTSRPRPTSSNHSSDHTHLAVIGSKGHADFSVRVRIRVRARVRVSCIVTSRPRLYAIQPQPRPRVISGAWFQEPRPHYCYGYG